MLLLLEHIRLQEQQLFQSRGRCRDWQRRSNICGAARATAVPHGTRDLCYMFFRREAAPTLLVAYNQPRFDSL